VADVGKQVGIEFAFDRIPRQPNTIPAHLLIRQAASGGHQDAMVESLFRGYFLEGADLTSREVLSQLAERAGLSAADAGQARSDPLLRRALGEEEQTARRLGVEGVPFFIIGGRVGVSGAQEPEVLLRAIEQATAETAVPAELF
jgi:predicted DsbA family dithiol-disulfide isomerase